MRHEPAPDDLDPLYAKPHRVEVSIELAPDDWQVLRSEGRSLFDGFIGESQEFAFTEFTGAANVDGVRYENVVVRKKGFLGSLSRLRPSLKLDFGEVEDQASPHDLSAGVPSRAFERLTLNNNRQDYSRSRTCLAYDLFARALLPSPRCNLAHVVVNGEDLGTYANVEPIKKPLLSRYFGDGSGNLYEGQLADFVSDQVGAIQLKTHERGADRNDLTRLVSALEADDTQLMARLGEVLDLDQFRDFWALETLAGHWDGYSGNRNNYYVYANPVDGRLQFLPWGTDGAFAEAIPGDTSNTSAVVYARGLIAKRLYALPAERARFRQRLTELNERIWVGGELASELDELTALASDTLPAATAELRAHLETHGELVREQLSEPAPEWVDPSNESSPCFGTFSDFSLEFATDYGDLAALDSSAGGFAATLSMDGATVASDSWFGRAGVDSTVPDPTVAVRALTFFPEGRGVFVQLSIPPAEFLPGQRSFHGFESVGLVVVLDGDASRFIGFISGGTIELDAASASDGAPVRGRARGRLLQTACADL
jgi:spore coat protein H